jgi:hypothetical protein
MKLGTRACRRPSLGAFGRRGSHDW